MKVQNIRFTDAGWRFICEEAKAEGMSAAAFVREASMMRAIWARARRGGPDIDEYDEVVALVAERLNASSRIS